MSKEQEKTRYSYEELMEFKEIILKKLEKANNDYELYKSMLSHEDTNDIMDTSPTFKVLEEGANVLSKEEIGRIAQRQLKFIQHLQAALARIETGTYGVCRETGKLISKERLRAVPHATLSMDAKMNRK
ncbi:MAG: TraR/DksA family transcriptional regulator [Bacteroidales bacterium]|jgi:RNA polymerase-binding transcription factor DksA|nr:TraR/DksA C4-type zinc finger protein [Bacteroidales bacterium]MCK9497937.1 TraR/DksA C4-type zinc finger protein [Bacteroidales bacterium]MDY0314697.1 TraR/DksA C4-type zinc finger protein [Bacteroidales bacterium]NLB86762.1 TraR/DksA family transcriptional regulator [Bacteroidales bacterium]